MQITRRSFLAKTALSLGALNQARAVEGRDAPFQISLAEWSLHRTIQKGELKNLDFPAFASETFGIKAVEYVSGLFESQTPGKEYVRDLKKRCDDIGSKSLLVMVDGCGALGLATDAERAATVEKHRIWMEVAQGLGCHSIRVNAHGIGADREEKAANCIKGLTAMCEAAAIHGLNILVENHGGLSSDGAWLAGVLKAVDLPNCGSLPDFGNFVINRLTGRSYDRYQGLEDLMPLAKAVSAKSRDFDEAGEETDTDFTRAMEIVTRHGYEGFVGIEYEGRRLSEIDGIRATQRLLERIAKGE